MLTEHRWATNNVLVFVIGSFPLGRNSPNRA
jgi:hypothetical protein